MSSAGLQSETIAKTTWDALSACKIAATPERYQTLYVYFADQNQELRFQLDPYIKDGLLLTAELLDYAHDFYKSLIDEAQVTAGRTDEISKAAQQLVSAVSANHEPSEAYGATLDHWAMSLTDRTTVQELVKAVSILSRETGRASQRNRALERQLNASSLQIAKLQQEMVDVKQEAKTCSLTGIANRKAFDVSLRRAVIQAKANPADPLCLLMLDVDHFKRFNDTHGHRTGDHVLKLVAHLLSNNVKGKDTVARYGGEEFAILLSGANLEAGVRVAGQICERIGSQRLVKRGTGEAVGQITMSIGVAQLQEGEGTVSFVERADAALYEAKRTGRSRVCAA